MNFVYFLSFAVGCTESLPVADAYNVPHKQINENFKPIGSHVGGGPSIAGPTRIVVKEKLFSWSGDSFDIKQYPSRAPYGNGLKVKGKAWSMRDQMALLDGNGKMVALCLRKFEFVGQTFKVYVPKPRYPGQKPSDQTYNGSGKLYTYCEVKRVPFSISQEVFMDGKGGMPEFVITRAGSMWPKKRLVTRRGIPACLMEGGTWESNRNSYKLTVNPGVDPCLMVCICAICDEMDEQN